MAISQTTPAVVGRRPGTVADLLRMRARDQPDQLGYTFLADGETDERRLSYAETDRRARSVAAALRRAAVPPGARAILVLPPGLDYVTALFGCLYAGVVAVPVYPPDPFQPERSLPRLQVIVRDAAPAVVLTTAPLLAFFDQVARLAPELGALRWLAVDTAPEAADDIPSPRSTPETTALLQYTSGSTAAPRGVVLTHANLLHNSGLISTIFRTGPETRALVWLPPYHDMGLIGGLLQPLYGGFPVTLMSPLHFLEQPLRWLQAIDRHRATASGGPNFAYDLCARRCGPDDAAQLDLSSWRVAFNGAEPIHPETLRRFAETFAPSGFRAEAFLPCYGLAEATLIVSGTGGWAGSSLRSAVPQPVEVDRTRLERHEVALPAAGPTARLTTCGPGAPDQLLVVVDPQTRRLCPPGRVGEIWVSGPSVAAGYWRQPEATEQTFRARLADGDGPFLRTGDLGFLHNGQLVVTGRRKDLVVVRGRNHYPQDLERTAERADASLRPGGSAAFTLAEDGSEDRLVLVHEVRRGSAPVDVAAVASRVRRAVAQEHGVQVQTVVLVGPGGVPKTSSGKVQRQLCRRRLAAGELTEIGHDAATPGDDETADAAEVTADAAEVLAAAPEQRAAALERYLRGRVAALTGVDPAGIRRDAPLLGVGLDSLAVIRLRHRVDADLGLSLSLPALLGGAGLAELVEQLGEPAGAPEASTSDTPMVAAAGPPTDEVAPISIGQHWVWFLQHLEPRSTAYTIAVALRLPGRVDGPALQRALDTLVDRHSALRTTFPLRNGEPVQLIRPTGRAAYREHDGHGLDDTTLGQVLTRASRRPFDLETGPLLRLDLYRGVGDPVLLVAMHHAITDFWSLTILARELGAYYTAYAEGRELVLPVPRTGHADVVRWQRASAARPDAQRLATYWEAVVADGLPRLTFPPPDDAADLGGSRYFALPPALADRLYRCAAAERVTPYVLLLAAFQATLLLLTGQDDVVVGANAAARSRPEFAEVVGFCTNPIMVRSTAAPGEPFRALLARTRRGVIGALEHQDFPIMQLVGQPEARRGALFDALFSFNKALDPADDVAAVALVGTSGVRRSLGALTVERFPLPAAPGALPVELVMAEVDGVPHGVLRHRGDVVDAAGADRLVTRFIAVLEAVAGDPTRPIAGLGAPVGTRPDSGQTG